MTVSTHPADQQELPLFREKPDGTADPAGEAGWFLERERTSRGLSLEQAGLETDIHPHHLSAIEQGNLTGLPTRTQTLKMIGNYAQYLNFDPQPLVLHYAQFLPREELKGRKAARKSAGLPRALGSATIIAFPLARRIRDLASGAGGIVASLAAAVAIFGAISWVVLSDDAGAPQIAQGGASTVIEEGDPTPVASISNISESELEDDAPTGLARASEEPVAPLSGLGALIEREIGIAVPVQTPADAQPRETAGAKPELANQVEVSAQGRTFGVENGNARLVISAKDDVWFRIEDLNGNVVVTKTLRKGDRYRVPNRQGLVVIARDGGMLTYSIDGEPQGQLGLPGEILVGNPLDIEKLKKNRS